MPEDLMNTYKVPHTDLVVSRIAYGTAMLGSAHRSSDFIAKTVRAMHTAYDNGITFFDLADVYGAGRSEAALSELLKQLPGLRDKIVIQSKCGLRLPGGWVPDDPLGVGSISADLSREHIVGAVEASLERLGTDHLDILLLHMPDPLVEPEEVGQAFDHLKGSGKVRYFGVSNHNPVQIELLRKDVHQPLVANQIRLGLAHYFPIAERQAEGRITGVGALVDYCRLHDIQVQAYSPLRGGNASDTPILVDLPADASPEVKQVAQMVANIAKKHNTTGGAVMLAWLLRHPAGIVPIIGASKPEHIMNNCAADQIDLSREEWNSLFYAAAAIQPKVM